MVARGVCARVGDVLRGADRGQTVCFARIGHSIRRLRSMAAAVATGHGVGTTPGLLEKPSGGTFAGLAIAYGSAAPAGPSQSRCVVRLRPAAALDGSPQSLEPARRRDPVHDVAGGVQGVA